MGLSRAGFDVVGVDNRPQPRYPFTFVQGDALSPPVRLEDFDFIWASPPCQAFTDGARARVAKGAVYPNLIAATRALLARHPVSAIENIMKAPIRRDVMLHGHMFDLRVIRRRKFELSFGMIMTPTLPKGLLREGYVCVVGKGTTSGVLAMGLPSASKATREAAMGIDWMTELELANAIPPAYGEFIGRAALQYLRAAA